MTTKQIIKKLDKYRKMKVQEAVLYNPIVNDLFVKLLANNPTKKEFVEAMDSIVFTAEMLYESMIWCKIGKSKEQN